jgi:hypothetical protein
MFAFCSSVGAERIASDDFLPHTLTTLTGGLGGEGAGAGAGEGGAFSFFAGAGAATTDAAVLAALSTFASLLFGVGVHADADAFKPWLE